MRPLFALVTALLILGIVQAFVTFQAGIRAPRSVTTIEHVAQGKFSVDVTLTFDAAADEFSLEPAAVVVLHHGKEILLHKEPVPAGQSLVAADVPDVVAGRNEFYVKAAPAESDAGASHAVRVRILRDGLPVADETLWSAPGEPVEGTVMIDVPEHADSEHEHH